MRGSAAISRRMAMKYARSFYAGRVRSFVKVSPLVGRLCFIEANGKIVGQGDSWETAYMNLRANLPTTTERATDWATLDAQVTR